MTLPKTIRSATSLDALLAALRTHVPTRDANGDAVDLDLTSLPTYGGDEPDRTDGVWSWDADRLLVGTCVADMRIVSRSRETAILVRVSREEKRRLEEAARRAGQGLGPWLRSLGLTEAARR